MRTRQSRDGVTAEGAVAHDMVLVHPGHLFLIRLVAIPPSVLHADTPTTTVRKDLGP